MEEIIQKTQSDDELRVEKIKKFAQQKLESQMNKKSNLQFKHRYSFTKAGKTKIG